MPGLYSHTTRSSGTTLTALIYNADHQNHVDNSIPTQIDDYSSTVAEMQTQTDPGDVGTESLATSLAGEIARLRYAINNLKGTTYWYEPREIIEQESSRNTNGSATIFLATGIPTWSKCIFISFNDVTTTSGAGASILQAHTATGAWQINYTSVSSRLSSGGVAISTATNGFAINHTISAAQTLNGVLVLKRHSSTATAGRWTVEGDLADTTNNNIVSVGGTVSLSGGTSSTLDKLSLVTTLSTWNGGNVRVSYL